MASQINEVLKASKRLFVVAGIVMGTLFMLGFLSHSTFLFLAVVALYPLMHLLMGHHSHSEGKDHENHP